MKMKSSPEVRKACCIVCQLVFCCSDCRWKHEQSAHGLTYDCPICRGNTYLCKPQLLNRDFVKHLYDEHLPLQCKKCHKHFTTMEDLTNIDECISISELVCKEKDPSKSLIKEVDEKFDSLYDKVGKKDETDNFEAIISVNKFSKTAVITPIVRKKTIVDYDSSESEAEPPTHSGIQTPHPKLVPKTPKIKRQRAATPHAKKLLSLMKQKAVEEYEETVNDDNYDGSPATSKTTPLRSENGDENQKEMTTPTSHVQHVLKIAQIVTTSTPTHPVMGGWALFPEQSADSPLSEIENAESPAQSTNNEPSKSENLAPKLKSIIITGSKIRLGSQDSSEKHVTFQDQESVNNTDTSSIKQKKVKFADDTVFEQENKIKRVYRKPKRMLTPGPQKPRFCLNPRFQALINRFENHGQTVARTPVHSQEKTPDSTPATGEPHMPARAINFKDDSPVLESNNYSKESNELFKTCVDSPTSTQTVQQQQHNNNINTAITALTTNIASSLQNCLTSVLRTTEEETEIQFKFVITKKKVSVKRIADNGEGTGEKSSEFEQNSEANKENIWSSVAKAVRNVFWGEEGTTLAITTPYKSCDSNDSTSSSASKRKCDEMTDPAISPLNHKRHRYDGRIRCRPPLRRTKTWGVSSLRSSKSAEQQSLMKEVSIIHDDAMNQSF